MMKGQKGITLVALIITIIVMLILVAVTISIALSGGIFDKARTANKETRMAQIKEAVALAKGEIIADYYDPQSTTKFTTAPQGSAITPFVNEYLKDDTTLQVTVSGASGSYTVTPNDSTLDTFTFEIDLWGTPAASPEASPNP